MPRKRPRPGRRSAWIQGRHIAAFLVLLLLGITLANRGFGISTAYMAPAEGGEGGARLLLQGQERPALADTFASASAPMTVVGRHPVVEDEPPPTLAETAMVSSNVELAERTTVVTYTVAEGDTLEAIAEQYGVAPYTIFWVNGFHTAEVEPGMVLTIPPLSGVPHTVQPGQTLSSIADMYGVRAGNIVGYPPNQLKYPYTMEAGREIFIPGGVIEIPNYAVEDGERPPPTLVKMPGGEKLRWPTWGDITAPFGWSRAYGGYHHGMDIANEWGTPIYAAAAGEVIEAGWGGLGWYVVLDHGNGFRTEYGHMCEQPLVSAGDRVEKGQRIGSMGRTYGHGGYATGVHLHFAVLHHGVFIDPRPLLER